MSFDLIARHYRWLETITFANKLQMARIAFLDQMGLPKRALITGEGTGSFLCELLRKHPSMQVDCVDASRHMLALARDRTASNNARVRFLHENLLTWSPEENSYDLVVSHFFLDCFNENEVEKIVGKVARSAVPSAIWLVADFSIPEELLRKLHAQTWLWVMHRFFRAVARISARELTDPSPFLLAHGFRCVKREQWRLGLVGSQLWQRWNLL